MPRFNPNKWKPADDSSRDFRELDLNRVVLLRAYARDGRVGCPCGCGEFPEGRKATFKMGHDARLRGKLIRAHLMGVDIRYLVQEPDGRVSLVDEEGSAWASDPMEVAKEYDWEYDLRAAELRREGANRQLLRHALNTDRTVKVGRWEYTGQVAAVFPTSGGELYLIKYVDRAGNQREIRVPASEAPLAS